MAIVCRSVVSMSCCKDWTGCCRNLNVHGCRWSIWSDKADSWCVRTGQQNIPWFTQIESLYVTACNLEITLVFDGQCSSGACETPTWTLPVILENHVQGWYLIWSILIWIRCFMFKKVRHFCISVISSVMIFWICWAQVFHVEIYRRARIPKFKK